MVKCMHEDWRPERSCATWLVEQHRWWAGSGAGAQWEQWGCRVDRCRVGKGLLKMLRRSSHFIWSTGGSDGNISSRGLAISELRLRSLSDRQWLWECIWGKTTWRMGGCSSRAETLVAKEADSRGGEYRGCRLWWVIGCGGWRRRHPGWFLCSCPGQLGAIHWGSPARGTGFVGERRHFWIGYVETEMLLIYPVDTFSSLLLL